MDRRLLFCDEHQRKEKSAHAAVAVNEGVDGLELRMHDGCACDDSWTIVALRVALGKDESMQFAHQLRHMVRGRRDEAGVLYFKAPNPVLDVAQLPGRRAHIPHHELFV